MLTGRVRGIALDDGDLIVAFRDDDGAFPTTTGVFDRTHNGGADVVVARVAGDLSGILAATYLGGADNDHLDGDEGDDLLEGGDGRDLLRGHTGDDVIDGGAGNDIIHAGQGDDQISGGEGNDLILAGQGDDLRQVVVGHGAQGKARRGEGNSAFSFGSRH